MKLEFMLIDKIGFIYNEFFVDNELDICSLCCIFWCGKVWIIGMVIFFVVIVLGVFYLVK